MKKMLVYFLLFNIFIYTPAIVNWYAELYIFDILIFLLGSTYIVIKLLSFKGRILKISLFLGSLFLYFSFAYTASGNFLNPVYGIKQLNLFFSLFLLKDMLKNYNLFYLSNIIKNFFVFLIFFYLLLYFSGLGMGFMPNSLLPRLYLENLKIGRVELIGASAILTGTFFVVVYIFFFVNKNIKNRKVYIFLSFLLIVFSGTRASLLEVIFGTLFYAYLMNKRYFFKILKKTFFILLLLSPIIITIFYKRIFDEDSNSVHLMLWGMAIAMFLQNPLTGMGANTFHKLKNQFVDYNLPESYGVHSTLFKFLGEGGILLILFYILAWFLIFYFIKKKKFITSNFLPLYNFALSSYFILMFHSIFDNYFMAKLNEFLYILFISIMYAIYIQSRRMSCEKQNIIYNTIFSRT